MKVNGKSKFEIWAQLCVSRTCINEIHSFFRSEYKVEPEYLIQNLHLTIYHARRPMQNLSELRQNCNLSIDTLDTRFMVLAPGGENPRPDIIQEKQKIGIRIKKSSNFRNVIEQYRDSLIEHETPHLLGNRKPSIRTRNAFGARNFQPHIAIIKSGNGIVTDLSEIGDNFRDFVQEIKFDKFIIHKTQNF
ncbi:MAG: hypothetical protein V4651_13165 [Bacteroidota bacterium]